MNKKEKILQIALELFANQGFDNTSTSLIAKKAEVSEGLIFRHFINKNGLLNEVLLEGFDKIRPFIEEIINEDEAIKIISKTIDLPFKIINSHREFWRLQNNLRLQNQNYRKEFDESDIIKSLESKIHDAFKFLKVKSPKKETEVFLLFITGLGLYILNDESNTYPNDLVKIIRKKFTS